VNDKVMGVTEHLPEEPAKSNNPNDPNAFKVQPNRAMRRRWGNHKNKGKGKGQRMRKRAINSVVMHEIRAANEEKNNGG